MRLLIDARPLIESAHGGVGRVGRALVAAYAAAFPDDELVCVTTGTTKPQLPDGIAARPNVRSVHLSIPNKLWSSLSCLNAVSLVRETERRAGRVDAVFFPNLGFVGPLGTRHSALLLHDLSFLIEPRWFTRKQRMWHVAVRARDMITRADSLLAVSETTKQDAMRLLGIPAERITVMPIGPTIGSAVGAMHESPLRQDGRYALALGWNDPRKNARTAVEAVRRMKNERGYEDIELFLVGAPLAGALRSVDTLDQFGRPNRAGTRPAPTWIHIVPHPSDSELSSLYAHASAFLYPSWYEGYGLPLHEAAAFGTPRIASTAGALPETAPPGTLFAHPAKPHHWVEALRMALETPKTPIMAQPSEWSVAAGILRRFFH